jgi:hypothetical protein
MDVGLLSYKELTPRVQIEDLVKVLRGHILKLVKVLNTSIWANDVELATECSFCGYEEFLDFEDFGISIYFNMGQIVSSYLLSAGFEMSALIATALPPARSIAWTTLSAGPALRE